MFAQLIFFQVKGISCNIRVWDMGIGRWVCILIPKGLFRFILEYDVICNLRFFLRANTISSSLPRFGKITILKVKMRQLEEIEYLFFLISVRKIQIYSSKLGLQTITVRVNENGFNCFLPNSVGFLQLHPSFILPENGF